MRKRAFLSLLLFPFLIPGIISCDDDTEPLFLLPVHYEEMSMGNTFGGGSYEYFFLDTSISDNVDLTYTLDGLNGNDVYFIFTNASTSTKTSNPRVATLSSMEPVPEYERVIKLPKPSATMGTPEITEFNRNVKNISPLTSLQNSLLSMYPSPVILMATAEGDILDFHIDEDITVAATCRKSISVETEWGATVEERTRNLHIWVADDCWTDGGTKAKKVTQSMVDLMAIKFLNADTSPYDDDIYDWLTNIFGEPWGEHIYGNLIPATAKNSIDILLYDINDDNSTNGGVLGFFWSKDNYLPSALSWSNGRLMFYLDAVLYATNEGMWDLTDVWPQYIISTLAHEFQHMISFYQKAVTYGNGSETWIDEMCSLSAEDLVSKRLGVDGPRGVDYNDPTDGSPFNQNGRLPLYNYYNDISVSTWYSGNAALASYSINYALGAYLVRNFGGAVLFREIVQSADTDYRALENATGAIFSDILRQWGVSVLLSDFTNLSSPYEYNQGSSWFQSTTGSITYDVGSINLYNYYYAPYNQSGPYIYTSLSSLDKMEKSSNKYFLAGSDLIGSHQWEVRLSGGTTLTVLVREP